MRPRYRLQCRWFQWSEIHVPALMWRAEDEHGWRTRWCDSAKEACREIRAGRVI